MKILVGIVLYGLFFGICYIGTGTDKKNMRSFYSYPDEIQKAVYENELLVSMIPKKSSYISAFLLNLVLFTVVFCVIGIIISLDDFVGMITYFILLGQGLNLFDLLVIDLIWWRNTKRTKFKELDVEFKLYKNPQKHISAFFRGIPMFLCASQ